MADSTFLYRAIAGVSCFVLLGLWDYWKHPENPTRVREYLFLFGVTAVTMAYGVVHDFGTWLISHDYYATAKAIPSAPEVFGWPIVRLALLATWNVGLIGAVIVLLSNNPDAQGRQLPYRRLLKLCLIPLVVSLLCESCFGIVFYFQSAFMRDYLPIDLLIVGVDDAFVAVWGMHLGAYIGAGFGVLIVVVMIVRAKRRLPAQAEARSKGWRAWLGL